MVSLTEPLLTYLIYPTNPTYLPQPQPTSSTPYLTPLVTALNITGVFPNQNITSSQMLEIPTGDYTETCSSTCSPLNTTIINCAENTTCVCADTVVTQLVACEQCMFNDLVKQNERAPDPRVGSNLLLSRE